MKKIYLSILTLVLCWGLIGCSDRIETPVLSIPEPQNSPVIKGKLTEVAPPSVIQELSPTLDQYEPQVKIINPEPDRTFQETTVTVRLQVQDLPIFKDSELELGPHVHLILDNEPYQSIYALDKPYLLENLSPGTHTLRAFAVRPWHESFKNDGAYAQTTFHIFTKSSDNNPARSLPLLTYSSPQGTYGAEPVLLDFYLTNAPLHLVARENPNDEISDWRIRATVNGESFLLDNWQSIYLKGLEKGENWVKLEFIDEKGSVVDNVFNNTVRVITYDPQAQDTLSKIVTGEIKSEIARSIVDPNYKATLTPPPTPTVTPAPSLAPSEEIIPTPTQTPEVVPSGETVEPTVKILATVKSEGEQPLAEEKTAQPIEIEIPATVKSEGEKPLINEEINRAAETPTVSKEEKIPLVNVELVGEKVPPTPTPTPEVDTTSTPPKPVEIIIKVKDKEAQTITLPIETEPKPETKPLLETPSKEKPTAKRPQWLENLLDRLESFKNKMSS